MDVNSVDNVYDPLYRNITVCGDLPDIVNASPAVSSRLDCLNNYGGRWIDIDAPSLTTTQINAVQDCRDDASPVCNGSSCSPGCASDWGCTTEVLQCVCWEREVYDCLNADTANFPKCSGGCTPSTCTCYDGSSLTAIAQAQFCGSVTASTASGGYTFCVAGEGGDGSDVPTFDPVFW